MAAKTLNFKLVLLGASTNRAPIRHATHKPAPLCFASRAIARSRVLSLLPLISTPAAVYLCVHAGDAAVGKSSSVERFVKNEFFEFQQPTIGSVRSEPQPCERRHFAHALSGLALACSGSRLA